MSKIRDLKPRRLALACGECEGQNFRVEGTPHEEGFKPERLICSHCGGEVGIDLP